MTEKLPVPPLPDPIREGEQHNPENRRAMSRRLWSKPETK